jgi:hypothetical protein
MLLREAVVIGDYVINSSDENCLLKISPFSANLHAITAISDCCFLDILGPPYKVGERDCHYYEEIELVSGGQPDGSICRTDFIVPARSKHGSRVFTR